MPIAQAQGERRKSSNQCHLESPARHRIVHYLLHGLNLEQRLVFVDRHHRSPHRRREPLPAVSYMCPPEIMRWQNRF